VGSLFSISILSTTGLAENPFFSSLFLISFYQVALTRPGQATDTDTAAETRPLSISG
jgi:hypothetical protein